MNKNELDKIIDIFINNLPDNLKDVNNPILIDLVLDGGIFNGSYLLGALYFLHLFSFQTPIFINYYFYKNNLKMYYYSVLVKWIMKNY